MQSVLQSPESSESPHTKPQIACAPNGELYLVSVASKARGDNSTTEILDLLINQAISPSQETSSLEHAVFWAQLAASLINKVRELADPDAEVLNNLSNIILPDNEAQSFLDRAPNMLGIEYCSLESVHKLWCALGERLAARITHSKESVDGFLRSSNQLLGIVGRVFFHLAENKHDPERPFAFMATYTSRISEQGRIQHVPLARAIQESGATGNKSALLAILLPVHKVATQSQFIKGLVDSGAVYHPQPWGEAQAFEFLQQIALFESFGIGVRVPNWWNPKKPRHPVLQVTIGEAKSSSVGLDAMLDFSAACVVDGKKLTEADLNQLLAAGSGLVRFKGEWIEVDSSKLQEVAAQLKSLRKMGEVSLAEGLRLLAQASISQRNGIGDTLLGSDGEHGVAWREIRAGKWLQETLENLRNPENSPITGLKGLQATLRPYQEAGVRWLWYLYSLGLGGCLADDMGLGKTLQIISFLLMLKNRGALHSPALLVVPASLIGNWKGECVRFAPSLRLFIAHSSESSTTEISSHSSTGFKGFDVVLTTYSGLLTQEWISELTWSLVVIDEAQAIKNSGTKQSKAARATKAAVRFALTGTPVENQLGDLWSLFDFINPGLLGTTQQFAKFIKVEQSSSDNSYGRLRTLIQPYLLRRLKTDKRIISDLPDKSEVKVYCGLSPKQIALYQQSVTELAEAVKAAKAGIQRKGLVLSYLMRFKQICNHPAQWLGHGDYKIEESGKVERLVTLFDEIAARQDKVLIFSQFREVLDPLRIILQDRLAKDRTDQSGFVLHGDTAVKNRQKLVTAFQGTPGTAFFLLSLKAGGTGLNLTAASHVIHFDRWWNPAVENQATDRAFRIGQKKNVLVHKFICRGTIEEKIDQMISSKQQLSTQVLADGAEKLLTEMSDEELISFVSLDLSKLG
jgi:non-specific serine/threonine protein kinase